MVRFPEIPLRYPTRQGRMDLAARLGLEIDPFSQDWEWEVADVDRFSAWLKVYRDETLSDDERFSLGEMLVQCVEDMLGHVDETTDAEDLPQWSEVEALLLERLEVHAYTIAYWSGAGWADESHEADDFFRITPAMRRLLAFVKPT